MTIHGERTKRSKAQIFDDETEPLLKRKYRKENLQPPSSPVLSPDQEGKKMIEVQGQPQPSTAETVQTLTARIACYFNFSWISMYNVDAVA